MIMSGAPELLAYGTAVVTPLAYGTRLRSGRYRQNSLFNHSTDSPKESTHC